MSKQHGRNEGDRAEWLALYLLSTIGFVTPVPRQSDHFGIDALLHLAERKDKVLEPTGASISVQIKSNRDDIAILKRDHLNCFYGTSLPMFFVVMDRTTRRLDVFSALHRIIHSWTNREKDVLLRFNSPVSASIEGNTLQLNLGEPIASFTQDELEGDDRKEKRQLFFCLMKAWGRIEQVALAWRTDELPFSVAIHDFRTNTLPEPAAFKYPVDANPQQFERTAISTNIYLTGFLTYMEKVQTYLGADVTRINRAKALAKAAQALKEHL